MKIFLISGLCYSGKTHVSNILCKLKENYFKGSFAKALKNELHDAGLIDKNLLKDKKYKTEVRSLMQKYGQEKRKLDKYYWAKKLEETIKDNADDGSNIFIDDWRFCSESDWFEKQGYKVIKIQVTRSDYYKLTSVGREVLDNYYLNHHRDESEQELFRERASFFDKTIVNNNNNEDNSIIEQMKNLLERVVNDNAMQN